MTDKHRKAVEQILEVLRDLSWSEKRFVRNVVDAELSFIESSTPLPKFPSNPILDQLNRERAPVPYGAVKKKKLSIK